MVQELSFEEQKKFEPREKLNYMEEATRATRNYECVCGEKIEQGTEYMLIREVVDGHIEVSRQHIKCPGEI